jgi:cytochrome c oxidase subunit 2
VPLSVGVIVAAHTDIALASAPTFLRPESATAREINSLAIKLLFICALVFVVVEGLLIVSIIRFRTRREEDVRQLHGNTTIEVVWTLIPAVLIAIIFFFTVRTMNTLNLPGGDVPVHVTGHQWWWEVRYPQAGVTTANEIHVPAGRSVDVSLASADVIHSFWVPQLGGKTDAVPGHTNRVTFLAATPGLYQGQCAEFCGLQHAHMRFDLVVESPAEFSAWLAHQAQPAAKPPTAEAQRGEQVFLANPCAGCHAVRGTAALGVFGPDLTHLAGRRMIAAGTIENTPENIDRWLRDPQMIKPGALMPTLPLGDADRTALVAYLEGLE